MNDSIKKIEMWIISIICIFFGVFFLLMCYMTAGMIAPGSKHPEPAPMIPLILGIVLIITGTVIPLICKIRKKKIEI